MPYEKELSTAIEAVALACRLCANVQHSLVADDTIEKADRSPVTIADYGSQAVVNLILGKVFPDDSFVCEEDSGQLRRPEARAVAARVCDHVSSILGDARESTILDAIDLGTGDCDFTQRYWALDPIDGTKGFLRGDQYAVALGLVVEGEVVLGVLGCPNLPLNVSEPCEGSGCLFVAVKGEGARVRSATAGKEREIRVDTVASPEHAVFCESVESAHTSHVRSARIAELLGVTAHPYRIDSQCKYGAVARGDASIYLRLPSKKGYIEKIWDHAAGSIIVREAGGTVTDIEGKPLDFTLGRELVGNTGIIATNGLLHDAFLSAIGKTEQSIE